MKGFEAFSLALDSDEVRGLTLVADVLDNFAGFEAFFLALDSVKVCVAMMISSVASSSLIMSTVAKEFLSVAAFS